MMKIPAWIKALAYLRFIVQYDGLNFRNIEKKFWSYEEALKYKNNVLDVSVNLSFTGFHVFWGWRTFYMKIRSSNCNYVPALPKNLVKKLNMWTAEEAWMVEEEIQ